MVHLFTTIGTLVCMLIAIYYKISRKKSKKNSFFSLLSEFFSSLS